MVLFWLFSLPCFAVDISEKLNYRQDTGTLIPGGIYIEDQQTIDAPIGDSFQTPILKIKINNQGPFLFALSTNNYETIISENLAKKLKLPKVREKSIISNQGERLLKDIYIISNMEMGGMTIKDYGVMASSKFGNDTDQISTVRIDGYLSANAFYDLLLTLDLKNEKIHVQKGRLSAIEEAVIPYSTTSPLPIIKAKIKFSKLNKEETQHFLLSTGNYMYIFVNACKIPQMRNLKSKGSKGVDIFGNKKADYFTELEGEVVLSKSIVIRSPYIYLGESACRSADPLGLLGVAFFEKYKATLDQANSLVRITKYE